MVACTRSDKSVVTLVVTPLCFFPILDVMKVKNTIVLVTCVAPKRNYSCAAKDLYQGPLFQTMMKYAYALNPKKIFILSGKHHLLPLDTIIAPYDVNLEQVPEAELQQWSKTVLNQLRQEANLKEDHFVFLTSPRYRKYLVKEINSYDVSFDIDQ